MEQEGLLKPEVKKALENIVGQCFINNRYADRIASILSVSFVMPNASNEIHHRIAHMYLNKDGADAIGDYMDSRNSTTIYPETLIGNQTYSDAVECVGTLLKNQLDLEKVTQEAIDVARRVGDITTKSFLEKFLVGLIPYTSATMSLLDKANQYNISDARNCASFDHDINTFGLEGLERY